MIKREKSRKHLELITSYEFSSLYNSPYILTRGGGEVTIRRRDDSN